MCPQFRVFCDSDLAEFHASPPLGLLGLRSGPGDPRVSLPGSVQDWGRPTRHETRMRGPVFKSYAKPACQSEPPHTTTSTGHLTDVGHWGLASQCCLKSPLYKLVIQTWLPACSTLQTWQGAAPFRRSTNGSRGRSLTGPCARRTPGGQKKKEAGELPRGPGPITLAATSRARRTRPVSAARQPANSNRVSGPRAPTVHFDAVPHLPARRHLPRAPTSPGIAVKANGRPAGSNCRQTRRQPAGAL